MNIRRLVPFAVLTLATSLLSGCSDSSGAEGPDRVSIASLMGQNTDYSENAWQEQEAQVQDLIATCMAEEGWEYIPVEYPDMGMVEYTEEDELERLQREGYGISYWTLNQGNEEAYVDPYEDWVDPNTAIIEAMSEDEMTAYNESLWGTQEEQEALQTVEIDPETGEEMIYMTGNAGCYGEASEAVYVDDPTQDEDYWNAFGVFYEEMGARVEADPRIKALATEWVGCMTEKGYDFDKPTAIWETVYPDFQGRHDEIVGSREPFEGWTDSEIEAFFESATEEEIDAQFSNMYTLTDEQREALEVLLAEEIELAVAEYGCSTPYWEKYSEIATEIEERYAIEHQEEIEELVLSFGITE